MILMLNMTILILIISCISVYIYSEITGIEDSKYKELVETIVEEEVENLLDIKNHSIDGKIDLSPNSEEK